MAINKSLDSMAKLFATAVTDKGFRQQIHDAVATRFDGDTDVLYKTFAKASGSRARLATAYRSQRDVSSSAAISAIDRTASDIPRFQIAVPARFKAWKAADYVPLVASMPTGVEDTTLQTITAYDAQGTAHTLNAQVAPDRPVIVLGLNERTDDAGRLLHSESVAADPMKAPAGANAAASSRYQVRMTMVHLIHDNEPWPKGSAEISLHAQGCGLYYTDIDWSNLNDDGDYWSPDSSTRVLGDTTCGAYFYWWEDDGGSYDFTLSYKGVSLGVHMDDGDDLIGGIHMTNGYFAGGTDNKRSWSDLSQWTD